VEKVLTKIEEVCRGERKLFKISLHGWKS